MVATNDAHYLRKKDAKAQKVLVYVQIKKTISEESGMGFDTDEFYLKSEEEMQMCIRDRYKAAGTRLMEHVYEL